MRHWVAFKMPHEDGLAQKLKQREGVPLEKASGRFIEVADQVVPGVALRADQGILQPAMEGSGRKFTDRIGPAQNGGNEEGHAHRVAADAKKSSVRHPASYKRVPQKR